MNRASSLDGARQKTDCVKLHFVMGVSQKGDHHELHSTRLFSVFFYVFVRKLLGFGKVETICSKTRSFDFSV